MIYYIWRQRPMEPPLGAPVLEPLPALAPPQLSHWLTPPALGTLGRWLGDKYMVLGQSSEKSWLLFAVPRACGGRYAYYLRHLWRNKLLRQCDKSTRRGRIDMLRRMSLKTQPCM